MGDKQTTRNIFSSDGRLLHAELAFKNVGEAGTVAGLVCTDGIVIIGINHTKSLTIEKIYKINDETYACVAGIFSDALRLIKYARLKSANIYELTGSVPKISVLCENIAKEKQLYTQLEDARPFGVAFLYSGYEEGGYVLYSTDPSGTVNRWKACSFGLDCDKINGELRNFLYDAEKTSTEQGLIDLMNAIGKAREWASDVAERMEVLLYSKNDSRMMKTEEIKDLLKRLEGEKAAKS